jgi:hypothetical protein
VLGALSAALVILLTTLLVKRVSGNRTTEIGVGDPDSVEEFPSGCPDDDVIYNTHEILEIIDDPTYND